MGAGRDVLREIIVARRRRGPDETRIENRCARHDHQRRRFVASSSSTKTKRCVLEPGVIEFEETVHLVKESVGKAELKVVRINGADGRVSVHYKTKDIDAIGTRDYTRERAKFSSS